MVDGRVDAILELARTDALTAFLAPFVHQAADEFPAALAALRDRLPVADGPIGLLGGSLGGAVALEVLLAAQAPVRAVALVNPAVRVRSVVELVGPQMTGSGEPYRWTAEADAAADRLDFVARVGELGTQPPLLLVSGERDHPALRTDAAALADVLRRRYARPDDVELTDVPGLAHPLAEEPGLAPAPQRPVAAAVDGILTAWFRRQLAA